MHMSIACMTRLKLLWSRVRRILFSTPVELHQAPQVSLGNPFSSEGYNRPVDL